MPLGKGTIPYELITESDSLNIVPDNKGFVLPHNLYSSLKDTKLSNKEYENVKSFYKTVKLKNLGDLSKIYNFQYAIIICEILEQRSSHLQELFKYNAHECISASSFNDCVHINVSIKVKDEDKEKINSFPCNSKAPSMLKGKNIYYALCTMLYALLCTRARWLVTDISKHFMFEQSKF